MTERVPSTPRTNDDAPARRPRALFVNASESRTQNVKRELLRRGWRVDEFRCAGWLEAARGLKKYLRALRRSRFVVAGVGFPWQGPWLLLARALGRKVVIDCPMDITAEPFPEVWHWKTLVRYFCRRADCFMTIASRDYLVAKFKLDAGRVLFLESCPDPEQIARAGAARPRIARPPGGVLIGYSGVAPWQRIERFVPVFKALRALMPNARWVVVSDLESPMIGRLRRRAEELGVMDAIDLLPVIKPVEDFFATIAQCQMWVGHLGDDTVQGRHELRMELLEMGALGMPVVFAPTPALERHGFDDGENVILINPDDAAASAERLARYLSNPALLERVGARLRGHVLQKFSLADGVDRLLSFVEGSRAGATRPGEQAEPFADARRQLHAEEFARGAAAHGNSHPKI